MRTNQRVSFEVEGMEHEPSTPSTQRVVDLIKRAKEVLDGNDLYIDCSSSLARPVWSSGTVPCITPSHGVYSTRLNRHLTAAELLNCQGMWSSCFSEDTYAKLVNDPKLAQDLVGNAFSSTVFQAVFLTSLVSSPHSWDDEPLQAAARRKEKTDGPSTSTELRRVKGKRKAPEFGPAKEAAKCGRRRIGKRGYKRKNPKIDSRTKTSKGKKVCATLWDKEQLSRPYLPKHRNV